jgi:DNA-binding CsgD family transcriptional regulator
MSGLPPTPDEITELMLATAFGALTPRECEVLLWIARGKQDSAIATILGMRTRTATTHVSNILAKLHVESRRDAAVEVVRVVICGRPFTGK